MRKIITTVVLLGIVFILTAAAVSSTTIQAILFPTKVTIHHGNQITTIDGTGENGVINYNNKAYIPLRTYSEAMGATVDYQSASEQTGGVHQIDIIQSPSNHWFLGREEEEEIEYWKNMCGEPIGLTVWGIRGEQNSTYALMATITNFFEEDITIVESVDTKIEVFKGKDSHAADELVYSQHLPSFEGLIPSNYSYYLAIPWNGEELDGGKYLAIITRPSEVRYTTEGDNTVRVQPINHSMGCNLPVIGFELR